MALHNPNHIYQYRQRIGIVPVVAILGVITLHFEFFTLAGFPVTPAIFLLLLFLGLGFKAQIGHSLRLTALALLALPWINAIQIDMLGQFREYLESYALWSVSSIAFAVGLFGKPADRQLNVPLIAFWVLAIVAVYSCLQYGLATVWNNYDLYNPWRGRQYLYQLDYQSYARPRAAAFYLEPSFNALVMVACFCVLLIRGYRLRFASVLLLIGLASSQSLAGVLSVLLVALLSLVGNSGRGTNLGRAKASLFALLILSAVALASQFSTRLESLGVTGSSANARLIAPFDVVREAIAASPTGIALGQMLLFTSRYDSVHNQVLHNGIYVLAFHFGWIAILIVAMAIFWLAMHRHALPRIWILSVIALLAMFTGSIMTPEFALLLLGVIYAFRTRHGPYVEKDQLRATA